MVDHPAASLVTRLAVKEPGLDGFVACRAPGGVGDDPDGGPFVGEGDRYRVCIHTPRP